MGSAREGSNPFAVASFTPSTQFSVGDELCPGSFFLAGLLCIDAEHSSVGRAFDCRKRRYRMVPGSIPGVRIFVSTGLRERKQTTQILIFVSIFPQFIRLKRSIGLVVMTSA